MKMPASSPSRRSFRSRMRSCSSKLRLNGTTRTRRQKPELVSATGGRSFIAHHSLTVGRNVNGSRLIWRTLMLSPLINALMIASSTRFWVTFDSEHNAMFLPAKPPSWYCSRLRRPTLRGTAVLPPRHSKTWKRTPFPFAPSPKHQNVT